MKERILFYTDEIRCWNNPTPSIFKFGSYVGTVLLTDVRFLFLSTGNSEYFSDDTYSISNSVRSKDIFLEQMDLPINDLLQNQGSLNIRFPNILNVIASRRWDFGTYFSITIGDSSKNCYSFQDRGLSSFNMEKPEHIVGLLHYKITKNILKKD